MNKVRLKGFDLRQSIMMRLRDESVAEYVDSARESSGRRRIGLLIKAFKRIMSSLPIGSFNGELWRFGGKCYVRMTDAEFCSIIVDCLDAMDIPAEDMLFADRVARICRGEVMKKELVPMPNIVIFENCAFDVERRMELAFSPKYVQMSKVDYPHVYNEKPYEFLNFLDYVLPDKNLQMCLQEYLGCVFIEREKAKIERILILLGSGANGKSVVFDTVMGVLGRDNVSNFGLGALVGGSDRKHNIASMNGKRLNYCSEIRLIEIGRDSDSLKTLISGEPTEARLLYGNNFMARSIPLLMANANKLPRITDMSHGMKRRLCVVRFGVTVPPDMQNPQLSDDLKKEYPGIFNWILEGKERFVKNGYKLSYVPNIDVVLNEECLMTSTPLRFMKWHRFFPGDPDGSNLPPVWRLVSWIYQRYVKWCVGESIIPESVAKFGRELGGYGYVKRRTGKGYEYALFGKEVKATVVTDVADVRKVITQRKDASASLWVTEDGNPMILGSRRLSYALGVSMSTINRFMAKGWFKDCYDDSHNVFAFDLKKCKEALRKHEVIQSASHIKEARTERSRRAAMRKTFNKRMEALELPYRKYKHKDRVPDGLVWVPDDATVYDLLNQEGGAMSSLEDNNEDVPQTNNTENGEKENQ